MSRTPLHLGKDEAMLACWACVVIGLFLLLHLMGNPEPALPRCPRSGQVIVHERCYP